MRILQINLVINEQPSSPALLETTRWSADTNIRFDSGSSNKLKNGFKFHLFGIADLILRDSHEKNVVLTWYR